MMEQDNSRRFRNVLADVVVSGRIRGEVEYLACHVTVACLGNSGQVVAPDLHAWMSSSSHCLAHWIIGE